LIDEARAELHRLMAEDAPPIGAAFVVEAPREADLLTLRALRWLQNADLVVYDPDAPEAVVDAARRDARRIPAAPAAPRLAAEEGAGGLGAGQLVPGDAEAAARALRTAGVEATALAAPQESSR